MNPMQQESNNPLSSGNISVTSSRFKQPEIPFYTRDSVLEAFKNVSSGFNVELAQKYPATMKATMEQVELNAYKNEHGTKLQEAVFGRNLFEQLKNSLRICSDVLEKVVLSNFQLETFISSNLTHRSDIDKQIRELEMELVPSELLTVPDKEVFLLTAELQADDDAEAMMKMYYDRFLNELSQQDTNEEETASTTDSPNVTVIQEMLREVESVANHPMTRRRNARNTATSGTTSDSRRATTSSTSTSGNRQQTPRRRASPMEQFEESKHYEEATQRILRQKELNKKQAMKNFIIAKAEHQQMIINQRQIQIKIDRLTEERKMATVVEIIGNGTLTAIGVLLTKVKVAINEYPYMRTKMQGRVMLANGDIIIDPFTKGNLCGIYTILYKEYNKVTMGMFCHELIALLNLSSSESVTRDRPEQAIVECNKHLKTWQQLDLYSFMDMDKLFTIALLNSFHKDAELRSQATMAVVKYMNEIEQGDTEDDLNFQNNKSDMPIYNHLLSFVNDIYSRSRAMMKESGFNNRRKDFNNSTQGTQRNQSNMKGQEAAMTANTDQDADTTDRYDGYVTRDMNISFHDSYTNRKLQYLATKNPCSLCSKATQSNKSGHNPKCYTSKCTACGLYGHNKHQCRQTNKKQSASQASISSDEA